MLANTMVVAFGGAQETHEYYLHYILDFQIGDYAVRTDAYQEVVSIYENFAGTKCDRSRPECWQAQGSIFIILPNEDIVALMNEDEVFKHSLSTFNPDAVQNVTLMIATIYRDRWVKSGQQEEKKSCLNMLKDDLLKNYGLRTIHVGDAMYGWDKLSVPIEVKVERIDSVSDNQQNYLDWAYKLSGGLNEAKNKQLSCEKVIAALTH